MTACLAATPTSGLANPASVYCEGLVIADKPDGQVGYSHMPDGRIIEEWALYRNVQSN